MESPKLRVVEYTTADGVVVYFHPLSSMTAILLRKRAESKYPIPPAPRIPAPNAADPGVTIENRNDEAWQAGAQRAKEMQSLYYLAIKMDAVVKPHNSTEDDLINLYAERLSKLEELGAEFFEDEPWLNTLLHCVFAHVEDERAYNQIIKDDVALEEVTEEGIADYVRVFRVVRGGRAYKVRNAGHGTKPGATGDK